MSIERLAYLGFGVEDPQAWLRFATQGLGLVEQASSDGIHRLRFDDRAWRIAVHPSERNDILYAGLEVAGPAQLEDVQAVLHQQGVPFSKLTPALTATRGVRDGIALKDPDGLDLEISYGHDSRSSGMPAGANFVTGAGGLGHFVLTTSDPPRSIAFYSALGFRHTDSIHLAVGPGQQATITFLHCNSRHHTVALAPLPLPRRLDHFMLERASIDEVIETYNRVRKLGGSIRRHLGRHPNDRMLSFYAVTPAGFDVEVGWDGVQVGPGWQPKSYDSISLWGHEAS